MGSIFSFVCRQYQLVVNSHTQPISHKCIRNAVRKKGEPLSLIVAARKPKRISINVVLHYPRVRQFRLRYAMTTSYIFLLFVTGCESLPTQQPAMSSAEGVPQSRSRHAGRLPGRPGVGLPCGLAGNSRRLARDRLEHDLPAAPQV